MDRLNLKIAGLSLSLRTFLSWEVSPSFLPFVTEDDAPDFRIIFRQVDTLPELPGEILHEDNCYRVHPDGKGGYLRSFFDAPRETSPYGVGIYDYEAGEICIHYLLKGKRCVSQVQNSFFHLDLASLMIRRQRLCFHAACVDTHLGGILFSGPSGVGKSTQADLWCAYRGAKQINGDRPILSRDGENWLAWGSPYAGSSRCYLNENCPVSAIVMLSQGKECRLRRLSLPEAFRAVWAGLTIQSWDKTYVETALALTMDLIGKVPVYHFSCTPDEEAVTYLEKELGKELACGRQENKQPTADGLSVFQGESAPGPFKRNL